MWPLFETVWKDLKQNRFARFSNNDNSEYLPKGIEMGTPKRYVHTHINFSIVHN